MGVLGSVVRWGGVGEWMGYFNGFRGVRADG